MDNKELAYYCDSLLLLEYSYLLLYSQTRCNTFWALSFGPGAKENTRPLRVRQEEKCESLGTCPFPSLPGHKAQANTRSFYKKPLYKQLSTRQPKS